jgi:transcriptional regulator with XRE-family HTH domain
MTFCESSATISAMARKQAPSLRAQWLGQQLRELRDQRGLTLHEAAEYLQRNTGTVSRFETAEYPIRRPDLMALLDLYRVSNKRIRDAFIQLSQEIWQRGWWDGYANEVEHSFVDYLWLERRACEIRSYDALMLPGLLQTEEYADAMIRAHSPDVKEEQIRRWVQLRMKRQQVLCGDNPPTMFVTVEEGALRRRVGGSETMRIQRAHLVECAKRPNIEVRVLTSATGAHPGTAGGFKVFTLVEPFPEVGYGETSMGAVYVEPPVTDTLRERFERLRMIALGPSESLDFISAIPKGR